MPKFVRVRLENGAEASVPEAVARKHGLTPLNKPAARNGRALPAKHNPLWRPAPVPDDGDHTDPDEPADEPEDGTPDTADDPAADTTQEKE